MKCNLKNCARQIVGFLLERPRCLVQNFKYFVLIKMIRSLSSFSSRLAAKSRAMLLDKLTLTFGPSSICRSFAFARHFYWTLTWPGFMCFEFGDLASGDFGSLNLGIWGLAVVPSFTSAIVLAPSKSALPLEQHVICNELALFLGLIL